MSLIGSIMSDMLEDIIIDAFISETIGKSPIGHLLRYPSKESDLYLYPMPKRQNTTCSKTVKTT